MDRWIDGLKKKNKKERKHNDYREKKKGQSLKGNKESNQKKIIERKVNNVGKFKSVEVEIRTREEQNRSLENFCSKIIK